MTPEQKEFLHHLRLSGKTNMYGAIPYLMERFDLKKEEAGKILNEWINTFEE